MSCAKPNFNSEHSDLINFVQTLKSKSVDSLISDITSVLKTLNFSTDVNQSDNATEYEKSIEDLVNSIKDKIKTENKLEFEFNAASSRTLTRKLKENLLPPKKTKLEQSLDAVIPYAGMLSKAQVNEIKYTDLIKDIYGDNIVIRSFREQDLRSKFLLNTIINLDDETIIDDIQTLNENLARIKSKEYETLYNYVMGLSEFNGDNTNFDKSLIKTRYYLSMDSNPGQVINDVDNIYTVFYNYLQKLKADGLLESMIENGWSDKMNGKGSDFFDALNSYVNLQYFDESIEQLFKGYISINRDQDEPVSVDPDDESKLIFKYGLSSGNKNMVHGWNSGEYVDAIDGLGGYSQILIETIPMLSYDGDTRSSTSIGQFQKLNAVYFNNAFSNLRNAINNMTGVSVLPKLLAQTLDHPDVWIDIFDKLFNENNDLLKQLQEATSSNGDHYLNSFDINILYSFYKRVLAPKKSYYAIEQKSISKGGTSKGYPITATFFGLINSTAGMNYLELVYDKNGDPPRYYMRVKRKYNSNTSIHDLIRAINRDAYSRVGKEALFEKYELVSSDDEKSATLFLKLSDNNETKVPITLNYSKGSHILTKNASVNFSQELKGVFDENGNLLISINTKADRERLFNSSQMTENEKVFMSMLGFIDDMFSTTFSKDTDGLLELKEFIKQGKVDENGKAESPQFIQLYNTAIRSLRTMKIYDALEKTEGYQKTQIQKFLRENPDVYGFDIFGEDSSIKRTYFKKDKEGEFLTVVSPVNLWMDKLIYARMIINGQTAKAVIKNAAGDSIPQWSPTYLGAEIQMYLADANSDKENNATAKLLFARTPKAIKNVVIDTDVKFANGTSKAISSMTESELLTHAIIDKFHLSLASGASNKTVFIQSTTFSDKTKYVGHEVSLGSLGITDQILYGDNVANYCSEKLFETVGGFYRDIWKSVLDDYQKIFAYEQRLAGIPDPTPLTISQIESKLNNLTEQQFTKLANGAKVTVYKDLHYRAFGKNLSINELLYHYANDLYASRDNLDARLDVERLQFVHNLIDTRTNFYIKRDKNNKENPDYVTDPIGAFIQKHNDKQYLQKWVSGNRLIPAKIKNRVTKESRNIEFSKETLGENEYIELNPFLESYFSVDVLLSNNLRFSLTGSEINHKIKGGYNIPKLLENKGIPNLFGLKSGMSIIASLSHIDDRINTTTQDLANLQSTIQETQDPVLKQGLIKQSEDLAKQLNLLNRAKSAINDELIYSREAGGQGAQLKRNVIIPATMRHYLQDQIDGIPAQMEIAVIDDIKAFVQNFDGSGCYDKGKYGSSTIDAHDGFAYINPIMSILENNSLQDNEVGDMKKNILHSYDHKHGVATLLKYAAGAITNADMIASEGSPVSLRNVFMKMSNRRWSKRTFNGQDEVIEWLLTDGGKQSGVIDLTHSDFMDEEFLFSDDILKGKELFYKTTNNNYRKIVDFGKEGNDYYTTEVEVTPQGFPKKGKGEIRVYHYFDNQTGKHIRSEEKPLSTQEKFQGNTEIKHSIDSIYELWTALGGLNSYEIGSKKYLVQSEQSLHAVANFTNYVANKKEGVKSRRISQSTYDQPLKRSFVAYLVNNSAIKNGAGNMNPSTSFYDNTPFRTITIDTKGHGVQLDADHHADEALMTEFSQVITSLDAGGRMHNYVRQIYNVLGQVALQLSEVELDAVAEFRETKNKSKLYDLIGRTIMKNMKDGQKGLLKAIMTEIQNEFNLNTDHVKDAFLIPFSDPNVYSQILSTFVSIINRKSIKRQYPGSGMVMMPAYDVMTIYDYRGKTYQFQDLLQVANRELSAAEKQSIEYTDDFDYNRQLVNLLLSKQQAKELPTHRVDWVKPAERINVIINDNEVYDITLDEISDYYRFKDERTRRRLVAEKVLGVKISDDYDKQWQPKPDNSHIDPITGKIKSNKAFKIEVKGFDGFFEIVKDHEDKMWSIHFKTGMRDSNGEEMRDMNGHVIPNPLLTDEIKETLFDAASYVIPEGEFLSTYGIISPGGIAGLNRFGDLNFEEIEQRRTEGVYDFSGQGISIPIYQSKVNIKFQKNVMKPRNLAPARIGWTLPDGTQMDMFDHWAIKAIYEYGVRDKEVIQEAFDLLEKGYYQEGYYDPTTKQFVRGAKVKVSNKYNIPAECIVPNIYQSKFNLDSGDSLVNIQERKKVNSDISTINSTNFDIAFTKNNNKNTYITFNQIQDDTDTFKSRNEPWTDIIPEEIKDPRNGVITKIWAVDQNNVKLFEVARQKIVDGATYKIENNKKIYVDKNGVPFANQQNYSSHEDKVLETITFVKRKRVVEKQGKQTNRYVLYNINRTAIEEVYFDKDDSKDKTKRDKGISGFIGKLMSDIYNSDDFNGVQLNTEIPVNNAKLLYNSLTAFANGQKHNQNLFHLIMGNKNEHNIGGLKDLLGNSLTESKDTYTVDSGHQIAVQSEYFKKLNQEINSSFLMSLFFTASRIPAQSHQSFMQMRAVAFTRGNVTHTYVSHFQTWLQGSDYDIDKAYMMGMSFNGSGKYVGWSNIFDYSSLESIQASQYLPMANGTNFVRDTEGGTNIDNYIRRINKAKYDENVAKREDNLKNYNKARADRIRAYADLITYLNDNNISNINWSDNLILEENILENLRLHEKTKIPKTLQEMAYKNFISSHIQNTVQNLTNMIGAYTPIEMEDFRAASENSPKGEQAKRMTLMNPATKYLMQYQNITGKNVIGIAATGIKAAFTWHYYMNEILQNNIAGKNRALIEKAKFDFTTSRIFGRAAATTKVGDKLIVKEDYDGSKTVRSIPDINWSVVKENNPETIAILFGGDGDETTNSIRGKLTVDLLQSQVLSAATDNAKELILAKVNAGSKLAKCYLFLITMGFDINDIVSFMTSPVAEFIDKVTEANAYTGQTLRIEDALELLGFVKGSDQLEPRIPNRLIKKYIHGNLLESRKVELMEAFKSGDFSKVSYMNQSQPDYYNYIDLISELKQIRALMPDINDPGTIADIKDFNKVLEGANEFSNFGRLLGINQGIKTTEVEFESYLDFIKNIIRERENAMGLFDSSGQFLQDQAEKLGLNKFVYKETVNGKEVEHYIPGNFDINLWLENEEYRNLVKDYYSQIKVTVPIFDIIDGIGQYKAAYKILDGVNTINNNIALKTRVINKITENHVSNFWTDRFRANLLGAIQAKIIQQYLSQSGIRFPYPKEFKKIIGSDVKETDITTGGFLNFDSITSFMSFKYLFEHYLIPALKNGQYPVVGEDGQVTLSSEDPDLMSNDFVKGLISGIDGDLPLYRMNIDMLSYDRTPEGTLKMEKYIKGLQKLSDPKYMVNGVSLSDWFILYNLYTNHNNYGSNRLTTLFDSMMNYKGQSSVILNYLGYVGQLDYHGRVEYEERSGQKYIKIINEKDGTQFNMNVRDLFILAAPTYSDDRGKSDPVIRISLTTGSVFKERYGTGYRTIDNSFFSGSEAQDIIAKQNLINSYLTIGGFDQQEKENLIKGLQITNIDSVDYLLKAINQLQMQNFLQVRKQCE